MVCKLLSHGGEILIPDRLLGVSDVLEPRVKGSHLEKSNVNSIIEMVELMGAFREFESVAQTLRSITTEMDKQLLAQLADLT